MIFCPWNQSKFTKMIIGKTIKSSIILLLSIMCFGLSAQTTIRGVVTDDSTGEVLIGANVLVAGTSEGTITDVDGTFEINTSAALPVELEFSYTGYTSKTMSATSSNVGNISLLEGLLLTDEIVVSASRRREKIQEAPASISVVSARKMAASPASTNPARMLMSMPGVTIQQQSAERINIQLRGDGGLFGSATFPIIDYRSLSGPGLGTFDAINSPLSNIDMQRIEVVRGPGSALYGPGVTSGVVHFITKSAIDNPGTTIELMGGELSTFGGTIRHATKVSDKFGFKINASYKRGGEFTLDPNDTDDALQIAKFSRTVSSPTITNGIVNASIPGRVLLNEGDLDPDGDGNMMQDFWTNNVLNATFEFRPQDDLSIIATAGTNEGSAVFYNSQGEGLSQSREFYGQLRMQKGGLFAQAFVLNATGGSDDKPTWLYQTGNTTGIKRTQTEAQVQYNFDVPTLLNSNFTAGIDYRNSSADTGNSVYGREEDDDDFGIIGAYLQGKFALGPKLDIVLAGRVDRFNFLDETAFQPRAVAVFKPSPRHTFRGGFNRAVASPSQLQINIDFPVASFPGGDFWLTGNKRPQTFNNGQIEFNSLLGLPSLPLGTPGMPNAYTFAAVNGATQAQLIPGLVGALAPGFEQQFLAAGLDAATAAAQAQGAAMNVAASIQGYINDPVNTPGGTTGTFVGRNLFNGQPLGIQDAPAATLRIEDTWEIGYKGLIGDKLGVMIDVYNKNTDGATLFTAISPGYSLAGIDQLGAGLAGQVASPGLRQHIVNIFLAGGASDAVAQGTADQLLPAIAGAYTAGGDAFAAGIGPLSAGGILATTPADGVPQDGLTHISAGYRTFESFSYTGIDAGLEYYVSQDLSLFANYSYLSDNVFNPVIVGSDGATERTSNSAPLNKVRAGFTYAPEFGWRGNAAFQHDPTYEVFLGQFSGDTEERNLVDAGVGYRFDNGLALDLTAQNLFDTEYRYYPNMPKLGRRVIGKLTYTFGADGPSDADGDGVKDSKDMCPNIAGLKAFQGCPDSDADGIKDSDDNCPMAPGDAMNGGCPDSDADGVIDNDDKCPNVAGTLMGCPDADGDGVADGDDMCPNAAGTLNGCPDGDGDGVADKDDNCPNAAGPVNGCPDGDGDGVADKDDKCPSKAGDGRDGCPSDNDGDGVPNDRDACPDTAGPVNGCPDGDKDGVADKDDKCPRAGGDVDSRGCPKVKTVAPATTAVFSRALKGIQFETGKAVIKTESFAILDEVVGIMNNDQGLKLTITGHTDNVGDENRNLDLSINRANAVKKYLETKGISPVRLISSGQGEYRPIGDNSTREGRIQNRRVELTGKY